MAHGTHYVYFLDCTSHAGKKCYYTGYTSRTPSQRFAEHVANVQEGNTDKYTGRFRYVKLVCYQSFNSEDDALKAEKIYKLLSHDSKTDLIKAIKTNAKTRKRD